MVTYLVQVVRKAAKVHTRSWQPWMGHKLLPQSRHMFTFRKVHVFSLSHAQLLLHKAPADM